MIEKNHTHINRDIFALAPKHFIQIAMIVIAFIFMSAILSSCLLAENDSATSSAKISTEDYEQSMDIEDFFGYFDTDRADELFKEINYYRESSEIEALNRDADLDAIARVRVAELTLDFSRQRLDGSELVTVMSIDDLEEYASAIAIGYLTVEEAARAWRSLDYQLENMENADFTHLGAAVLEHNDTYYWVVVYGQR